MTSPAFIFDADEFQAQVDRIKAVIGDTIPLCFSIKANPFLLNCLPDNLAKVEVCSPGELSICEALHVPGERIIYSGVMKEAEDVARAVAMDVAILTAESKRHIELENEACLNQGKNKKVILRLTSGNQFGMSEADIEDIIAHRERYEGVTVVGIHYYSGTQKKQRSIDKDLAHLDALLTMLSERYAFVPELVEYGPGLSVDYFRMPYAETDAEQLAELGPKLKAFAEKYPLGIEMGRYLATSCGHYLTQVKDIKSNSDTNYAIVDGGIHHLKYHGQTMAMQVPPIADMGSVSKEALMDEVITAIVAKKANEENNTLDEEELEAAGRKNYALCGSLCTVADVLVREVALPELAIGDYLLFGRCGAYSVTEGTVLFLSRNMPAVYLYSKAHGVKEVRSMQPSFPINMMEDFKWD